MASLQLANHLASSTAALRGRHTCHQPIMPAKGSNFYAALMNLSMEDEEAAAAKGVRSPSRTAASSSRVLSTTRTAATTAEASTPSRRQQQSLPQQQQQQQQQQQPSDSEPSTSTAGGAAPANNGNGTAAGQKAGAVLVPAPQRKRLRDPLVWIDLEMTGLDLSKDTIIEIACLVTDGDLRTMIEGPCIAIHHSDEVLDGMNDWCKEHHGASGLTERVRDSAVDMAQAQAQVLEFIREHTEYQSAQLAGNSVHVDKAFLRVHMPEVVEHLHYRIVDVSTVQELCRRWAPKLHRSAPKKVSAHTALSDIKESLKELQYYKQVLWKHR